MDLKGKIRDTVLSENAFTAGNMNDVANLAYRLNDNNPDGLTDFVDDNLTEGQRYKVVISTEEDNEHADAVYNTESGFCANFYKD